MSILQHCIAVIMMAAALVALVSLCRWGEKIVSEIIWNKSLHKLADKAIEDPSSLSLVETEELLAVAAEMDRSQAELMRFMAFCRSMLESYEGHVSREFIDEQWRRLRSGEKGIEICDAALVAWETSKEGGRS